MSRRTGGTPDFTHSSTLVTISRRDERSGREQRSRNRSGAATPSRSKSYDGARKRRSSSSQGRSTDHRREIIQRDKEVPPKLDDCVCGANIYGTLLGPTVDEQILAGLLALFKICHECPDEKWDAESSRRSGISESREGKSEESQSEEPSSGLTVTHSALKADPVSSQPLIKPAPPKSEFTKFSSTISPTAKSQSSRYHNQSIRPPSAKSESIRLLSGRSELMRSLATRLPCMRSPSDRFPSLRSDRRSMSEHISEEREEEEEGSENFENESLLIQRVDEEEEITIQAEIKNVFLPPLDDAVAVGIEDQIKSPSRTSQGSKLGADAQAEEEDRQTGHKDDDPQLEHVHHQPSKSFLFRSALPTCHSPEDSPPRVEHHHESIRHHVDGRTHQLQASLRAFSNREVGSRSSLENRHAQKCCSCCRCSPSSNSDGLKTNASLMLGKISKGSATPSRKERPHHKESSSVASSPYLPKTAFKPSKNNSKNKCFRFNCPKSKAKMVSKRASMCACDTSSITSVGEEVAEVANMNDIGDVKCKVRYAITRITKFSSYTTFEVMKSTRKQPRVMPTMLEGVFVLKNKKCR